MYSISSPQHGMEIEALEVRPPEGKEPRKVTLRVKAEPDNDSAKSRVFFRGHRSGSSVLLTAPRATPQGIEPTDEGLMLILLKAQSIIGSAECKR